MAGLCFSECSILWLFFSLISEATSIFFCSFSEICIRPSPSSSKQRSVSSCVCFRSTSKTLSSTTVFPVCPQYHHQPSETPRTSCTASTVIIWRLHFQASFLHPHHSLPQLQLLLQEQQFLSLSVSFNVIVVICSGSALSFALLALVQLASLPHWRLAQT